MGGARLAGQVGHGALPWRGRGACEKRRCPARCPPRSAASATRALHGRKLALGGRRCACQRMLAHALVHAGQRDAHGVRHAHQQSVPTRGHAESLPCRTECHAVPPVMAWAPQVLRMLACAPRKIVRGRACASVCDSCRAPQLQIPAARPPGFISDTLVAALPDKPPPTSGTERLTPGAPASIRRVRAPRRGTTRIQHRTKAAMIATNHVTLRAAGAGRRMAQRHRFGLHPGGWTRSVGVRVLTALLWRPGAHPTSDSWPIGVCACGARRNAPRHARACACDAALPHSHAAPRARVHTGAPCPRAPRAVAAPQAAPTSPATPSPAETARTIVEIGAEAVLCVLGRGGAPLGAPVAYELDAAGQPLLRLAPGSPEAAALAADARACLLVQPPAFPARGVAAVALQGTVAPAAGEDGSEAGAAAGTASSSGSNGASGGSADGGGASSSSGGVAAFKLHVESCTYYGGLDNVRGQHRGAGLVIWSRAPAMGAAANRCMQHAVRSPPEQRCPVAALSTSPDPCPPFRRSPRTRTQERRRPGRQRGRVPRGGT